MPNLAPYFNCTMPTVFLKPKKDVPVRRYHPWIFSGAIARMEGEPADGGIVEVRSHSGEFLATGHFQHGSIAVRIFSFEEIEPGPAFWKSKLQNAFDYRRSLGLTGNPATNCYRLVHAEGDGLPGLIVDVYGETAVVQCHSIGMHRSMSEILPALVEVLGKTMVAVYGKSKETLPANYAATVQNGYLHGQSSPQPVLENGHSFFVDWESGQKTGFFLDQRDNRQLLSKYAAGKSVLNAFCYSGGFSIYALKAGAASVHSADFSQKAIEWTEKNVALNPAPGTHEAFTEDVQKFLKNCGEYELMVVDPPAFAKNLKKRHNAVQGYKRLNATALRKVAPGGMLFTFSCSQVVDRALFYNTIVAAAIEAGRRVRVMHHLSQPADHPVSLFHSEGAYLKGLALQVE
ncbi:MAG: class I SAM-dependent rRNA methyltransferase [Saprospiraceae bacterium]